MIKIHEQEAKLLMMDELNQFDQFCDEHKLRYYLYYGTLLGAVRHQGFIPWDDDVDVAMPRPDYEKFLHLTKNGFKADLSVISMLTDPHYQFPFAKIINRKTLLIEKATNHHIGVYIDVFPLDGLPSSEKDIKKHYQKIRVLRRFLRFGFLVIIAPDKKYKIPMLYVATKVAKIIGSYRILRWIDQSAKAFDFDASAKIADVVWGYGKREVMLKAEFLESEKIKFENLSLNAPVQAKQWLTQVYGDYMTPPPLDQQTSPHKINAFWL